MAGRLQGKRAFVTAASAGIGRACAIAFAREGAQVFASDINESAFADLKSAGVAEAFKLDVLSTDAVDEAAKRIGKIDILLNAAGFVHHGTVLECSDKDWDFSFDLNVKSMHRTIKAFLPRCWLRQRIDREYRFGRGCAESRAEPLRVWRDQSSRGRPHPRSRCRLHHQGHPLQLYLPRHHRNTIDAWARCRAGRGRHEELRLAPAARPARHGGRNRLPCCLSCKRRKLLHDRRRACRGRRLDFIRNRA
jgi:hypothetical protein